jgi:hypothetical protein
MAIVTATLFHHLCGPADAVLCQVEYDDLTLAVQNFIIDNPGGHHVVLTVENPVGTKRIRETRARLNGFKWDPVIAAVVKIWPTKTGTIVGFPLGWSVSMTVDEH